MITNERQYKITRSQVEKIKMTMESFDLKEVVSITKSRILAKAQLDAIKSEYENLYLQIKEYETLKSGAVEFLKASSLEDLPSILIRARIAKGLSQRNLADLMGLKEQQIQRYESEDYASANLVRLSAVAKALSLNIKEVVEFSGINESPVLEANDLAWDEFPIKEMYKRNYFVDFDGSVVEAIENAEELLSQFINNIIRKPIQVAARQRIRSGGIDNKFALLAWQCQLISLSQEIKVYKRFNKKSLSKEWFKGLVELSRDKDGPGKAVDYLEMVGLKLIILPHLSNTHLDGAAILTSGGPIVGLTIRYDRLDNFWFVLIHELVHILKHLRVGGIESIFDDIESEADDIEIEADEEAGEILIPNKKWETALAKYVRSKEAIKQFSEEMGIGMEIVAGKIRRESNNYVILKDMVGQGEVRKHFPNVNFSF